MAIQARLCRDNYGYSDGASQNLMGIFNGENGFRFQKQELLPISQPRMKRACFDVKNGQEMALFRVAAAQMEEERREVDRFISYQNEKLRLAVQEHIQQQIESISRSYEAKMKILMKQKDQEISKAHNKNVELENFLKRTELECQTWQQVAKDNESMVESLNNTIEQYRESAYFNNQAEDSESCCDTPYREHEVEENVCRCCNFRSSKVVLLPCRHLCCCKSCEGILGTCPVCGIVKKASIEALF